MGWYALFLTVGVDAADAVYSLARERLEQHPSMSAQGSASSERHTDTELYCLRGRCPGCPAGGTAVLTQQHPRVPSQPSQTGADLGASLLCLECTPVAALCAYHSGGRACRFFHSVTKASACSPSVQRKQLVDSTDMGTLRMEDFNQYQFNQIMLITEHTHR